MIPIDFSYDNDIEISSHFIVVGIEFLSMVTVVSYKLFYLLKCGFEFNQQYSIKLLLEVNKIIVRTGEFLNKNYIAFWRLHLCRWRAVERFRLRFTSDNKPASRSARFPPGRLSGEIVRRDIVIWLYYQ